MDFTSDQIAFLIFLVALAFLIGYVAGQGSE